MNNSGEILLGALIGVLGSVIGGAVVPWIREVQTRRAVEKSAYRTALVSAVRAVLVILKDEMLFGHQRDRAEREFAATRESTALVELEILLTNEDIPVIDACLHAFTLLRHHKDDFSRRQSFSALSTMLPAWLRGDVQAVHVSEAIEAVARTLKSESSLSPVEPINTAD